MLRPPISSALFEASFAACSLGDFMKQLKEQGEQLPVLLRICDSLLHPHHVWQDFINSAQSPHHLEHLMGYFPAWCWHDPQAGISGLHIPRVPGTCVTPRQQGSALCLSPVAAPPGSDSALVFFSAASLVEFSSQCHIPWRGHICVLVSLFITLYWKILPKSYGFPWLEVSTW